MGDVRFLPAYRLVHEAKDRSVAIRALDDESLIAALAGTVMARDEYLANVLATEGQNRVRLAARALDAIPLAVLTISPMGRVVAANLRARELLGSAVGAPLSDVLARREDAVGIDAFLDNACGRHETRLRASNGREMDVRLESSPVEDEHGARIGTMLVIHDDVDWDVPLRKHAIAFDAPGWQLTPTVRARP